MASLVLARGEHPHMNFNKKKKEGHSPEYIYYSIQGGGLTRIFTTYRTAAPDQRGCSFSEDNGAPPFPEMPTAEEREGIQGDVEEVELTNGGAVGGQM